MGVDFLIFQGTCISYFRIAHLKTFTRAAIIAAAWTMTARDYCGYKIHFQFKINVH